MLRMQLGHFLELQEPHKKYECDLMNSVTRTEGPPKEEQVNPRLHKTYFRERRRELQRSVPRTPRPDKKFERPESQTSRQCKRLSRDLGDGTSHRYGLGVLTPSGVCLHSTPHALQISSTLKKHNLAKQKGSRFRRIFYYVFSFLSFHFFPQQINETELRDARLMNPLSFR